MTMSRSLWGSPWSFPLRLLGFIAWFTGQFVASSLRVVAFILAPGRQPEPAIVKLRVHGLSETEVTLLIALITITPDTLVISVDREQGIMFVHGMFVAQDADSFRASLQDVHDRLIVGVRARPGQHRGEEVVA